jgi:hypothetical protein
LAPVWKLDVQLTVVPPPNAAALQNVDRAVLGLCVPTIPVQLGIRFGLQHVEVGRCRQRTFLDQDHVSSPRHKDFRGRSSAGAGADDNDVGVEHEILSQRRRIDDLPAAGEPKAKWVSQRGRA